MSSTSFKLADGSGRYTSSVDMRYLGPSYPVPTTASTPAPPPVVNIPPVTPTFDPKIEANALYGKPMALAAIGSKPVRFGGSPAPIVGPYFNGTLVDFLVSIGLIAPVDGIRKLFKLYLDQELAWSSATGWDGSGAQPGDAIYHAEPFDLAFRPGTLTQDVLSLETDKFPGDENAYRPQVLIQIRNLVYQRYMDRSGRPVPYVSAEIGDFSNGRGADEQINLGEALELIAHSPWAGYTSSTFEAVNITDAVDGIIIKDNFTVVDLCRSVTRIYRNIDLLQSDKLRIKDRGNVSPDFVFDRDSIIGGEQAVQIVRSGATAQRRQLELITIDPDQDYTAVPSLAQIPRNPFVISAAVGKETITSPLVMDASTRQALVTYAQQYEENARKRVSLRVSAYGYQIEPGDLFALPDTVADGIDGEVFKCTQTEHGANYETQIEGEAILRCQLGYSPPETAWVNHYEYDIAAGSQLYTVDLGAEAADRVIVLVGAGVGNVGFGAGVISVTIDTGGGPEAMTIHAQTVDQGEAIFNDIAMFIASKAVPTGTTADIVVTYSNIAGSFIDVYRLTGLTDPSAPADTATGTATGAFNPATTIDVPNAGIVIGGFAASDTGYGGNIANFGPVTWTGLDTESSDEPGSADTAIWWVSSAYKSGLVPQSARPVSATNVVQGRKSIILGVWS